MDNTQDGLDDRRLEKIAEQWRNFQAGAEVDTSIISKDYVLRSWNKCKTLGLDPSGSRRIKNVSSARLTEITHEMAPLIKSSKAVMGDIFSMLNASRSAMVLASAEGVILHCLRSAPSLLKEGDIACEENSGTSGVSTCLAEGHPVELIGAEHWFSHLHNLVCVAAPIHDGDHEIVGILSITSHIDAFHPHTMGMMLTASGAISEQMRLRDIIGEQRTILGLIDEGVITFTKAGIIKSITPHAMEMMGFKESPVGKDIATVCSFHGCPSLLSTRFLNMNNAEARIHVGNKRLPFIISCAINSAADTIVLTLKEQKRMKDLANRMTGAHAEYSFEDIQGQSLAIRKVIEQARLAARNDVTTLILGESGTGKELFAQAMHNASERRNNSFIVVNCGALPRELVQSELFGYEEGAFTGARKLGKLGKFELADGGTIFLDEIGDMPLDVQVNLLRLLQNKEVSPIGGREPRTVNVRVIAATNKNLLKSVEQNLFREDLYYRLNVFPIELPSLRDRGPEDILLLAEYFLSKILAQRGESKKILPETVSLLQAHRWPGNIRELENMVERAVCLCSGTTLLPEHFPHFTHGGQSAMLPLKTRQQLPLEEEKIAIIRCLSENHGNVRNTAMDLGFSRAALYNKLHAMGIEANIYRKSPVISQKARNTLTAHPYPVSVAQNTIVDEAGEVETLLKALPRESLQQLARILRSVADEG